MYKRDEKRNRMVGVCFLGVGWVRGRRLGEPDVLPLFLESRIYQRHCH